MVRPSGSHVRVAFALALLMTTVPGFAGVQSDASRESAASLDASLEVPVAVATALSAGAEFVVTGVAASGDAVAVTISAIGTGVSYVVRISAEAASRMALATGVAIGVSVVAGGWLLSVGTEALCFVANEAARALTHTRRLDA